MKFKGGFPLWSKLIMVVYNHQKWIRPLEGDSIKAMLGRDGRCHPSRSKISEEFACCGLSSSHLRFQSSWGYLKLGLTPVFNRLCTVHLSKVLSEVGIPRKIRGTNHVSIFYGQVAYYIASTACNLYTDGSSGFGLTVPPCTHSPDPKYHKRINSSFTWDKSWHLSVAIQALLSDRGRSPVLVRSMKNSKLVGPDSPAWWLSLESE